MRKMSTSWRRNLDRSSFAPPGGQIDGSLPYTKTAKYTVEEIVCVDRADQGAQIIQRAAKFKGQELRGFLKQGILVGSSQMGQARLHMMAASAQARREGGNGVSASP